MAPNVLKLVLEVPRQKSQKEYLKSRTDYNELRIGFNSGTSILIIGKDQEFKDRFNALGMLKRVMHQSEKIL
jgi:hypothetical protein